MLPSVIECSSLRGTFNIANAQNSISAKANDSDDSATDESSDLSDVIGVAACCCFSTRRPRQGPMSLRVDQRTISPAQIATRQRQKNHLCMAQRFAVKKQRCKSR